MRAGFAAGAAFLLGVIAGVFLVAPLVRHAAAPAPATGVVSGPRPARQPPGEFERSRADGDQAMDAGRCEDAIAAYERALAVRFDADAATDRGVCLRQLGRREQALAAFEFVTLKEPAHWKARYNLTAMLLEAGRIDEAKASLAILERLRPDDEALRALRDALRTH